MTQARPSKERREGRGRLSKIDMLPEECDHDIVWALEQLRARKMHSKAILKEFNARIADHGQASVDKSSWNRWSVRKAIQFRRLDEGRQILTGIQAQLGGDGNDEITLVLGEMIKLAVFEQLEAGQREDSPLDAKTLGNLARTLRHAVKAQADTVEYRQALAELEERLKRVSEAVEAGKSGSQKGGSKETLAKITSLLTTGA
jgi:Protein of unknown function (DUF3486)